MDRSNSPPRRDGQTLLELIVAITLLALTLVPALRLMRDGLSISRDNETRSLLGTLCVSKMEEHLARTAATWQAVTTTGDFSSLGYPKLKFQVVRSDGLASGGITGRLMAITATAWEDRDNNGTVGSNESSVTVATKLAKMAVYENMAGS